MPNEKTATGLRFGNGGASDIKGIDSCTGDVIFVELDADIPGPTVSADIDKVFVKTQP